MRRKERLLLLLVLLTPRHLSQFRLQWQNLGYRERGRKMPSYFRGSLLHLLRKKKEEEKREPSPLSFSNMRFWIGSDSYLQLNRSTILSIVRIIFSLTHKGSKKRRSDSGTGLYKIAALFLLNQPKNRSTQGRNSTVCICGDKR